MRAGGGHRGGRARKARQIARRSGLERRALLLEGRQRSSWLTARRRGPTRSERGRSSSWIPTTRSALRSTPRIDERRRPGPACAASSSSTWRPRTGASPCRWRTRPSSTRLEQARSLALQGLLVSLTPDVPGGVKDAARPTEGASPSSPGPTRPRRRQSVDAATPLLVVTSTLDPVCGTEATRTTVARPGPWRRRPQVVLSRPSGPTSPGRPAEPRALPRFPFRRPAVGRATSRGARANASSEHTASARRRQARPVQPAHPADRVDQRLHRVGLAPRTR